MARDSREQSSSIQGRMVVQFQCYLRPLWAVLLTWKNLLLNGLTSFGAFIEGEHRH